MPSQHTVTTVNFKTTGTANAATFTLAAGACAAPAGFTPPIGAASDLCSRIGTVITHTVGGTTITPANSTLASINTTPPDAFSTLGTVAANGEQTDYFTFTITVASGLGNAYQGLSVNEPLVWTYSAGS